MTKIAMGFAARQTPESKFSHWEMSEEALVALIEAAFDQRKPGYRDGVCLVPVDPKGFFTGIVTLQEGDYLRGSYMPRRDGETPRKTFCLDTRVARKVPEGLLLVDGAPAAKVPAKAVDVVLYHRDVLGEEGETHEAEWLITSVNASPVEGEMPMNPATMMANHFGDSGGTDTHMTPEEFVDALRESYWFWRDKTFAG
jgi:hypothetical protein